MTNPSPAQATTSVTPELANQELEWATVVTASSAATAGNVMSDNEEAITHDEMLQINWINKDEILLSLISTQNLIKENKETFQDKSNVNLYEWILNEVKSLLNWKLRPTITKEEFNEKYPNKNLSKWIKEILITFCEDVKSNQTDKINNSVITFITKIKKELFWIES